MASYQGRHAELYDLFYAAKDYAGEAAFVHAALERFTDGSARRVVDLACGTGRHAVELAALGHEVVGVDHSEDMLRRARAAAAGAGMDIDFQRQDLRALAAPARPYDAAVCLFDSIGYVATNDALAAALRGIWTAVRPGGLVILEFWHAAAMLRAFEAVRVRRWRTAEGEVERVAETTIDVPRQLASVKYTVHEHRADGTFTSFTETQTNRYFLVQEMAGWLRAARLRPLEFLGGYSFDLGIGLDTWHVVAVARRETGGT